MSDPEFVAFTMAFNHEWSNRHGTGPTYGSWYVPLAECGRFVKSVVAPTLRTMAASWGENLTMYASGRGEFRPRSPDWAVYVDKRAERAGFPPRNVLQDKPVPADLPFTIHACRLVFNAFFGEEADALRVSSTGVRSTWPETRVGLAEASYPDYWPALFTARELERL